MKVKILETPTPQFKNGGSIHIAKNKRGTFKAQASKMGESVQTAASHILANKGNYSPAMVRKANFARNAKKWHHKTGGFIPPKAQWGEILTALPGVLDALGIAGPGTSAKKAAAESDQHNQLDINTAEPKVYDSIGISQNYGNLSAAAILGQATKYHTANYDPQITRVAATADNRLAGLNASKVAGLNNAMQYTGTGMRNISALGLSPIQSMNYAAQLNDSGQKAFSGTNLQYASLMDNIEKERAMALNAYGDINSRQEQDRLNIQQDRNNKKMVTGIGQFANTGIATEQSKRDALLNFLAARMGSRGATFNATQQANGMLWGNLQNSLQSLAPAIDQWTKKSSAAPYNPGAGNYGIPAGPGSPAYDPYDPYYQPNDPFNRSMYGKYGGRLRKLGGFIKK